MIRAALAPEIPAGGSSSSSLPAPDAASHSSATKYTQTRTLTRGLLLSTSLVNVGRRLRRSSGSDANLCPVCAEDLALLYATSLSQNNTFDEFKESHIAQCLVAFDFNQDHQRYALPVKNGARIHTRNKMLVYNIPPIPKPAYETIPNAEGSSYDTIKGVESPEGAFAGSVGSYGTVLAEKDVFGVDNECVICLEDLKPGDKVGRLECLCVFHYQCIKDWFKKKGYGECPVHFLHQ